MGINVFHTNIFNVISIYSYNQQSNHLASKIFPILEEKFREHFPGSSMNLELHHNLSTVIHKYADSVLNVMKSYYNRIEDMNNIHDLFKDSLGKYRVQASCIGVLHIFYDVNIITLHFLIL